MKNYPLLSRLRATKSRRNNVESLNVFDNLRVHIIEVFAGKSIVFIGLMVALFVVGCDQKTTAQNASCGDGVMESTEECDGTDLGDASCQSLGYPEGGILACNDDCTLNTAGCIAASCGNGVLDPGESCDGTDLGEVTCISLGFHEGGDPVCNSDCTLDSSTCLGGYCGDLIINGAETCDGPDMSAVTCLATCEDYGFYAGELSCNDECNLDPSTCEQFCGDQIINGPEVCDGTNLAGQTCESLGYHQGGEAGCAPDCHALDLSGCLGGFCGDTVVNGGEECEENDLGGHSCVELGYLSGELTCAGDCTLDLSGC
ncbi:hypothetical protein KKF84_15080, partial [Myxococcota bacterium]|nr:hypothetical protein [Myxococcota bacterium]